MERFSMLLSEVRLLRSQLESWGGTGYAFRTEVEIRIMTIIPLL